MESQLSSPAAATTSGRNEHLAASAVTVLSGVLAVGCVVLAIAHSGFEIPGVSALGPGGGRVVAPAAAAFSVAALLAGAVTYGAWRRRAWAWALGLVVHALVILGAAMPYRGIGSLIGILIGVATIATLLSRPGRAAFLPASR